MEIIIMKKYTAFSAIFALCLMSWMPSAHSFEDYYDSRDMRDYDDVDRDRDMDYYPYERQYEQRQYTSSRWSYKPRNTGRRNWIRVNLSSLTWEAYDYSGQLVNSGRVSGGKAYCPDIGRSCRTVTGTFTIKSKRGAGCKSTRFPVGKGGAPMPYCMFFHGGYALHGSNDVPNRNASHGCVRMPPEDARWLNQDFVRVGSTKVSINY